MKDATIDFSGLVIVIKKIFHKHNYKTKGIGSCEITLGGSEKSHKRVIKAKYCSGCGRISVSMIDIYGDAKSLDIDYVVNFLEFKSVEDLIEKNFPKE